MWCLITTGTTLEGGYVQQWWSSGGQAQLAGTRGFTVTPGSDMTFKLICGHFGFSGSGTVRDSAMSAMFFPDR